MVLCIPLLYAIIIRRDKTKYEGLRGRLVGLRVKMQGYGRRFPPATMGHIYQQEVGRV